MEQRRSALGELWAWLIGLVLPVGALASALAFSLPEQPAGSPEPSRPTTLVAGASAQNQPSVAPTATPRDSLSQTALVAAPIQESRADVAGVQVQTVVQPPPQPLPQLTPLIGTVGAGPVPLVAPAFALTLAVAGFAWRVHTSAPWLSRNRPHRRPALPA